MSTLITYYLEMNSAPDYVRDSLSNVYDLVECRRPQPAFNRFLYQFVGGAWDWTDRLSWSDERWQAVVHSEKLRTWVAYIEGAIAGYFELHREQDDVEILYFGLGTDFIGQGLGRPLLEDAVREAWQWPGVQRVWVHTCNLDHPSALQNYQRRGFKLYKTEEQPLKT